MSRFHYLILEYDGSPKMEVFILISMAMALGSSSTSSSSLQTSSTESTKGLSSGSFRKSHALLSFFPVLCKNSMSLNHRGDCIKTKSIKVKRKNGNIKVNKNLLKHILNKRRKKKPLLESNPFLELQEDSNSSLTIKDLSIETNIAISHHYESHNSSTNLIQEIENNINKDILVDIIKSTNLIANILQSKIETDEKSAPNYTEPPPSLEDSPNSTHLTEVDIETLSSLNTLSHNSVNVSESLVTTWEEESIYNETSHISSRDTVMAKNETNELNTTGLINLTIFEEAEETTSEIFSFVTEENLSSILDLNESNSQRESITESPLLMVVYPTVLRTNVDYSKYYQPLEGVTWPPLMEDNLSTPFTTPSPITTTQDYQNYWTIIPSILNENVSSDINNLSTTESRSIGPKNATNKETILGSRDDEIKIQNENGENIEERRDLVEKDVLNASIIEEDSQILDELLPVRYGGKYPFSINFFCITPCTPILTQVS
ncbi:unnamed protein product [Lepeophtheirus salmonis]|uniref:(salmon louse) hypothetical protein n=1 Tax=Lepeophtheirus salmonis TaxID=72036 RepID=A0A7R8CN69_LEPSM|nr:unnamed protein product [Lepeophtheirus salmonis]CAF2871734.1 unnamed protein product [Lepeophtheirus salmonis]